MPAVRTPSRSMRTSQEPRSDKSFHSVYLESARDEFSLRRRMPNYAPLSPPATPSPPPSPPTSPVSRVSTRSKSTPSSPRKKKAPNAFILYRSHVLANNLLPGNITHQNDVSVRVGELWHSETDEVKRRFYKKAIEEKERMEAQGLLGHGSQPEKARRGDARVRSKSTKRLSPSSSSGSSPRKIPVALSSPPLSPQSSLLGPLSALSVSSSMLTEPLSLPISTSFSEKVPDLVPGSEPSPLSQVDFDWSSGSFADEPCHPCSGTKCNFTDPCLSETDAWGAVRAYFDSHPDASGPSLGMTLSIASDPEEDLASLFAKTLDFRTQMPLPVNDIPHLQACASPTSPSVTTPPSPVQGYGWTPNFSPFRECSGIYRSSSWN